MVKVDGTSTMPLNKKAFNFFFKKKETQTNRELPEVQKKVRIKIELFTYEEFRQKL